MIVFHGANDPRDPVTESDRLVEALRKNGAEVRFLRFPDEGHRLGKRAKPDPDAPPPPRLDRGTHRRAESGRAIELLTACGVLVETTGKKRDGSWAYRGYLDRLRVGTDLDERDPARVRLYRQQRLRDVGP